MSRPVLARLILLALPALTLVACKQDKQSDDRTASGEVLDGTISDKMLPLDTVTSQPPLMKSVPSAGASDASEGAEDGDAAGLDAEQPDVQSAVE